MKKIYTLLICMLIILTPLNVYSLDGNEDDNLGEVITVSVDHYEPVTISADYLQAKEFPVNVFLRGFTLGSILFGDDSPETAPFFGGLNIRHMKVRAKPGSAQYVVGSITPVLPKGDYLRIDSNGEIDLGYLVVNLRSIKKEADIPDEITLNMTADFYFDSHTKFSVFGAQDLLLESNPNEQNWLSNPEGDFWSKKGYVRVIGIDKNKVKLQVYDGDLRPVSSSFDLKKNEEKTLTLHGGPSFLKDKVTIKLKDLLVPQTNAELSILEPSGIISEQTVIKGMSPFTGSSWTVKKIYSDEIIFEDEDGNQISLGEGDKSKIVVGDPCSNIETINEDELNNNLDKTEVMCTAIKEYETALEYADLGDIDETNYYLAQAYEDLNALPLAGETYKKISSGYNKYDAIQNTIRNLEQQIDQDANLVVIDGVKIFLKSINILEDKESYFEAKISGIEPETETTGRDFDLPVDKSSVTVTSCFGERNIPGGSPIHKGLDFAGKIGDPVYAAADGKVIFTGEISGYGKTIEIEHSSGYKTKYAHLNDYKVENEQNVDAGDLIGHIGNTGTGTGPHLHFEILENNVPKDPACLLNDLRYYYFKSDENDCGNPPKESKTCGISSTTITSEEKRYELGEYLELGSEKWEVTDIKQDSVIIERRDNKRELNFGQNNLGDYVVDITKIQPSDKQALVTVLPGFERAHATSDFTIRLPVEKSLIQWTPEQIDRKINNTRKIIKKLDDIVDKFGKIISAWKITCFSVYAFLTVKNAFFGNPEARKLVVEKYTKICEGEMKEDPDLKLNDCLASKNTEIEDEIDKAAKAIEEITDYKKDWSCDKFIKSGKPNPLGINENYFKELCNLGVIKTENIDKLIIDKHTDIGKFNEQIKADYTDKKTAYEKVKNEAISAGYINKNTGEIEDQKNLNNLIYSMDVEVKIIKLDEELEIDKYLKKNNIETTNFEVIKSVNNKDQGFLNGEVIGNLEKVTENNKGILFDDGSQLYKSRDTYYAVSNIEGPEYATGYTGPFTIEYNKDKRPEVFPFEIKPQDYKIPNTDGKGEVLGKYSAQYIYVKYDNGKPEFNAFNVGSDGKIDLYGERIIDDKPILTSDGIKNNHNLERKIEIAYNNFDKQHRQSDTIRFDGKTYTASFLKSKISQISAMQSCQYIMPLSDCEILFNVCDPVLCPASRFDLDGKWPVDSVVSTGIIGSLVLGQLNGNIPPMTVCFTGIHAGLDNIKTLFEGYEDCLQKAKVEGESVGICNEIRSVYICEMLWREVLAMSGVFGKFSNFLASKISGGKLTSGGEYSQWNQAWTSMGNSINFFTKQYATSAFSAFTARSTEEVGAEICKAAIFGKVPAGGDFISQLTQPESPPQFTAWITELEYGSIEEGQSLYRVYYHIYAGRDRDIIYNVYMRNYEGRVVSLNHESSLFAGPKKLEAGDFVDKSMRLTEAPGFNEICIQINGATPKCGFGKVSSAYLMDKFSNMLVESELDREINDAGDCKPDYPRTTQALGSLSLPANYGLTETGVMRKCFINDPDGEGDRWEEVGTCGTDEMGIFLGNCYVDHESYIKYGKEEEKEEEPGVGDREAKEKFDEIEKGIPNIEKFVKSDKTVIEGKIIELREIIRTSTSDEPIYLSYNLIARIYHEFAKTIKEVTEPGDTTGLTEEEFPCEIEYEEDSKTGLDNIVFKFEDGSWMWKNINIETTGEDLPSTHISYSPQKYLNLNEGQQSNLKDIFGDLIKSLDNLDPIGGNLLKAGINKLRDYANYNQKTEKRSGNDDYLIIINEQGKRKELDWDQEYFISYDDILTACDGGPREYNCIIEADKGGFSLVNFNWIFRFNKEMEVWEVKTKSTPPFRVVEGFDLWKPLNKKDFEYLSNIMNEKIFVLFKKIEGIGNSRESKEIKFKKGIVEFIEFQREKSKIYIINKGEKVYTPKTGKANVLEIYEACNFRYDTLEEEENELIEGLYQTAEPDALYVESTFGLEQPTCKIMYSDGRSWDVIRDYWFGFVNEEWVYGKTKGIFGGLPWEANEPDEDYNKVSDFIEKGEDLKGVYLYLFNGLSNKNYDEGLDFITKIFKNTYNKRKEKIIIYVDEEEFTRYSFGELLTKDMIKANCNKEDLILITENT